MSDSTPPSDERPFKQFVIKRKKPSRRKASDENWREITDRAERRRVQNRINQRARRTRDAYPSQPDDSSATNSAQSFTHGSSSTSTSPEASGPARDFYVEGERALPFPVGTIVKRSKIGNRVFPWASSKMLDPLKVLSPHLNEPKLRSVWQEAVNVYWPVEQHVPMEGDESCVWSFFKHSLGDNLLFNAMSAALSSLHDSRSGTRKHVSLMLQFQNNTIKLLQDELKTDDFRRDEFIFAILCMTPGETDPMLAAEPRPYGGFTPIATDVQCLRSNGMLFWSQPHKEALKATLPKRGGIGAIKISGCAELLQNNDIVECSHTMTKPNYPLCVSYQKFVETEIRHLRESYQSSCERKLLLTKDDIGPALYDVYWDMRAYIDLLAIYSHGSWAKVEMPRLATHRNLLQYRLLSGDLVNLDYAYNELALIGAQMFTLGVIYPMPNRKPQISLARTLKEKLEQQKQSVDANFLSWLLCVGGIAMTDLKEQCWFAQQLAQLYHDGIQHQSRVVRNEVMEKMHDFVWMDIACNQGFLELWYEVEKAARAES